MKLKDNYNHTIASCCIGYITQAIINNFVPLLFSTFQSEYKISIDKIAMLITLNFGFQILIDLAAAKFVNKIGYRKCVVAAHAFCTAGLVGLSVFPEVFPSAFIGIEFAVLLYAVGGGLIEVLVSPIVEACPTKHKEGIMSMLHSFYCWGHVFVVLMSTLFFRTAGIGRWKILACVWAIVPAVNLFYFSRVPINVLVEEDEEIPLGSLLQNKVFILLAVLMLCSGASEQGMSQWASAFAEMGLGVSKTVGDMAGPCLFASLMGLSRIFYSKFSSRINLNHFMIASGSLCVISYLLASLSKNPVLSFVGCALCGISVGVMWPGTFSLAANKLRSGGTAMFSLLALAGDLGCAAGPGLVGAVSGRLDGDLKKGLLSAMIFPVVLIAGLLVFSKIKLTEKKHG